MIFEDPTRKRWRITIFIFFGFVIFTLAFAANVAIGYLLDPPSPNFELYNNERKKLAQIEIRKSIELKADLIVKTPENPNQKAIDDAIRKIQPLPSIFTAKPFVYSAFAVQSISPTAMDMEEHAKALDIVFLDQLSLVWSGCQIEKNSVATVNDRLRDMNASVFSRFTNTGKGAWNGSDFSAIISDKGKSHCLTDSLKKEIKSLGTKGINIDVQWLAQKDREAYLNWIISLTESFHASGLYVSVVLPVYADPSFDYKNIAKAVDFVVVSAYGEHYSQTKPGPISSAEWTAGNLDMVLRMLPKEKTIVSIPAYWYDWNVTEDKAEMIGFDKAMLLASKHRSRVQMDPDTKNNSFIYRSNDGSSHEVWFSDSVTMWNQYQMARERWVRGIAFWRMGLEDMGVWKFMWLPKDVFDPAELVTAKSFENVTANGSGEIMQIVQLPKSGLRTLSVSGRTITSSEYLELPKNFVVERYGASDNSKKIALTFDGGPDKFHTEKILDILKKYSARATFFIVWNRAARNPYYVSRAYDEWHLIGSHTYLTKVETGSDDAALRSELNETQRIIEWITGKQSLLFRSPYGTWWELWRSTDSSPLYTIGEMGYLHVWVDMDSMDSGSQDAEKIAENVLTGIKTGHPHIILMHDVWLNSENTAKALDILIPKLQAQWYSFVTVGEVLGVSREAFMPPVPVSEKFIAWGKIVASWVSVQWWAFIDNFFLFATILAIGRIVFMWVFVYQSSRIQKRRFVTGNFQPPVTILVPAYNEEKVIERTIAWLLASDYPEFEILVIDDGSTDDTAERVQRMMLKYDNVRLITKKNEGKSLALNLGFKEARYDYVVTVDADTIVLPKTVAHLVEPFADDSVDAVCWNVWVWNVKNILTAFQEVEYVTGQNYDRRAFDALNCISVVPGATGAWKRQKVIDVGGYSHDTLVEDADLTLTLLEKGGRIIYAPLAKSVTEAPETVRALFKQRFRWSYGTFQCFWKHRHTFWKWTLGLIALPNMLLFQVIFPMLGPIGDFMLLFGVFNADLYPILIGYVVFSLLDVAISWTAYALDKKSISHMWVILIQRFFYRQFMYVITFKSLIAALRWGQHGWNKLERKASVTVSESS